MGENGVEIFMASVFAKQGKCCKGVKIEAKMVFIPKPALLKKLGPKKTSLVLISLTFKKTY
jgi:hypothetical protein